jgi:membrane-associated protein
MFGINVIEIVKTAGYLGIFGIIFAESGLMVGFFLPGDSLLFTAGFLASQHYLAIGLLVPLVFLAAIAGDNLGYLLGYKFGPRIFSKDDSLFFRREYAERAKEFFAKYGANAIVLSRFVPVVRTFFPVVAGVGKMKYRTYFFFDIIGGILWAIAIPLLGYYLGSAIPNIDSYLLPIVLLIVIVSLIPVAIQFGRTRRAAKK